MKEMIAILVCLISLSVACCPTLCLKNSVEDYVCNDMYSLTTHKIVGSYCITVYTGQVCKYAHGKYNNSCGWSCDCNGRCGDNILHRQYPTYVIDIRGYHDRRNNLWLVKNSHIWFGDNITTIPPVDNFPYECQKNTGEICTTRVPLTCVFGPNIPWEHVCNAAVYSSIQATFYYKFNNTIVQTIAVGEGSHLYGNRTYNRTVTLCGKYCNKTHAPTHAPTRKPTQIPTTSRPTSVPTTSRPTQIPATSRPTQIPTTSRPTQIPTANPTSVPTQTPTTAPTSSPTVTTAPSEAPSEETSAPSEAPSEAPSAPSEETSAPSEAPSGLITCCLTGVCLKQNEKNCASAGGTINSALSCTPNPCNTSAPTSSPTEAPTTAPTEAPTEVPTEAPTPDITQEPTPIPTNIDQCIQLCQESFVCDNITICESTYCEDACRYEDNTYKCAAIDCITCISYECNFAKQSWDTECETNCSLTSSPTEAPTTAPTLSPTPTPSTLDCQCIVNCLGSLSDPVYYDDYFALVGCLSSSEFDAFCVAINTPTFNTCALESQFSQQWVQCSSSDVCKTNTPPVLLKAEGETSSMYQNVVDIFTRLGKLIRGN